MHLTTPKCVIRRKKLNETNTNNRNCMISIFSLNEKMRISKNKINFTNNNLPWLAGILFGKALKTWKGKIN